MNVCPFSIGVSDCVEALKDLKQAYLQALEANRQQMISQKNVIFYKDINKIISEKKAVFPLASFQKLREALETDDKKKIDSIISEIFSDVSSYNELSYLLNGMFNFLSVNFFEQYPNIWGDENPQEIVKSGTENADNLAKLFVLLKSNLYKICDIFAQNILNDSINKRKIQKAMNYIENNICREITMAEVANYVDLSYSHFSRIFKNTVQMNFINYITEEKIKKAKHLLAFSELSIKEIGVAVGYKKSRYFSDIFKKATGYLPSEYRNQKKPKK